MDAIVRAEQTCAACPSQWNAWTAAGQYLYLRYRFGIGTADTYDDPDPETWQQPPDGRIARFDTEDRYDGDIDLDEFCRRAGLNLDPHADVHDDPGSLYIITIG